MGIKALFCVLNSWVKVQKNESPTPTYRDVGRMNHKNLNSVRLPFRRERSVANQGPFQKLTGQLGQQAYGR